MESPPSQLLSGYSGFKSGISFLNWCLQYALLYLGALCGILHARSKKNCAPKPNLDYNFGWVRLQDQMRHADRVQINSFLLSFPFLSRPPLSPTFGEKERERTRYQKITAAENRFLLSSSCFPSSYFLFAFYIVLCFSRQGYCY